jgi:GNAT superfamily N-acetyltransferase
MNTIAFHPKHPTEQSRIVETMRPTPLLDTVWVEHGPRDLIGRSLLRAAETARRLGISLHMGRGLHRLVEVNQVNLDTWAPLMPALQPDRNGATADNVIYLEGRDARGEVVITEMVRRYQWHGTNFKREFESRRFLYADPAAEGRHDEICVVEAAIAEQITGDCQWYGGLWCRPDFRGRGLTALIPRVLRTLALTTWDLETYAFGLVEIAAVEAGVLANYQYDGQRHQPGAYIRNSYRPAVDWHLVWRSRQDVIDDLTAQFGETTTRRRTVDKQETQRSPLSERQGNKSRS